jgi:hypothetical protein
MGIDRTKVRMRLGVVAAVVALAVSMVIAPAGAEDTTTTTVAPTTTTVAPTTTVTTTTAPEPSGPNPTFRPVKRYDVLRKLVFPVVGMSAFHASFGACRDGCTREHHGVDITTYGYKGLPIVAAHDGTVVKVTYDEGNPGCSVRIRGRDKWETRYYHLNNDIPGTDEIGAPCPAPGIEVGTKVEAGQIIGYMGDSGNGEDTTAHLHFELRSRSGHPIDPYRSLKNARRISFEWLPTDPQTATVLVSRETHREARTVTLVGSAEFRRLGLSEEGSTVLASPLLAVDRENSAPAMMEIERLEPERIVVLQDEAGGWLEQLARPLAPIVAHATIPEPERSALAFEPDAMEPVEVVSNPADRFPTVVTGVVDRIWRSRKPAYDAFIHNHRALVLTTERWAPSRIGARTWSTPGKHAEGGPLWWLTGDGWVGGASLDDAPDPGIAYVRERAARDYTLTFLGSLAELPPYPIWKSD